MQTDHTQRASFDELWKERGACSDEDLSVFFAPNYFETQSEKKAREARAKLICRACPVQEQCLEFGLVYSEGHGVWGGYNERERRRLAAVRNKVARLSGTATVA